MTETEGTSPAKYRIEHRGYYLYVELVGTMDTRAMTLAYQRDVAAAMTPELERRVLFDNRRANQAPEDLRAQMWTWVSSTPIIHRAALVAHTDRVHRRVHRTAELNRVRILAFRTIEEAEFWLRTGRPMTMPD